MSCAGNGYLTGNMLVPFPFEDGQSVDWGSYWDAGEALRLLQRCFVDASVFVKSGHVSCGWPSIGGFSTSDSSLSFVIDAGGELDRVSVSASSAKFPVVRGTRDWGSYIVVMSSEGISGLCEFCKDKGISPPAYDSSSSSAQDGGSFLRLCARCVTESRTGLSSIRVFDGVHPYSDGPHFVLSGDVSVRPGNNFSLSEPDEGVNGFRISAIPGEGLGRIPCGCTGVKPAKSPLVCEDGHVRLFNDTCYDIEPRVITRGKKAQLVIHAKCTACCTCDMYASIVNDRLASLAGMIRDAKDEIDGLLEQYNDAVRKFNARIASPTEDDVSITMAGMSFGKNLGSDLSNVVSTKNKNSDVKGRMDRCSFTAVVKNSSYFTIDARVNSLYGTDTIVEASASWSGSGGEPKSVIGDNSAAVTGTVFEIGPGKSLVITFVSEKSDMVKKVTTGGYTGSISVGMSYVKSNGARGSLGTIMKTVTV